AVDLSQLKYRLTIKNEKGKREVFENVNFETLNAAFPKAVLIIHTYGAQQPFHTIEYVPINQTTVSKLQNVPVQHKLKSPIEVVNLLGIDLDGPGKKYAAPLRGFQLEGSMTIGGPGPLQGQNGQIISLEDQPIRPEASTVHFTVDVTGIDLSKAQFLGIQVKVNTGRVINSNGTRVAPLRLPQNKNAAALAEKVQVLFPTINPAEVKKVQEGTSEVYLLEVDLNLTDLIEKLFGSAAKTKINPNQPVSFLVSPLVLSGREGSDLSRMPNKEILPVGNKRNPSNLIVIEHVTPSFIVVDALQTAQLTNFEGMGVQPDSFDPFRVLTAFDQFEQNQFRWEADFQRQPLDSFKFGGAFLYTGPLDDVPGFENRYLDVSEQNIAFKVTGTSGIRISVSDSVVIGQLRDGKPKYRSVQIEVKGLSAEKPFIQITADDLKKAAPDFHTSQVTGISIISTRDNSKTDVVHVAVESKGLENIPVIQAAAQGPLTNFQNKGVAPAEFDPNGVVSGYQQFDQNKVRFTVNLTQEKNPVKRFGGVSYYVGPLSDVPGFENRFFDAAAQDLVFKVTGTSAVRVSVSDDEKGLDGKPYSRTVHFDIKGISQSNPYVRIKAADLKNALAQFHPNKVTNIAIVATEKTVPSGNATITVESLGLENIPVLNALAQASLTDFSSLKTKASEFDPHKVIEQYSQTQQKITFKTHFSNQPNPLKQFGGVFIYTGPISEIPEHQNRYFNANLAEIAFKVSGVSTVSVSVSDNVVIGTNPDGTPIYRTVRLLVQNINTAHPFIRIRKEDLKNALTDFHIDKITSIAVIVRRSDVKVDVVDFSIESKGLMLPPIIVT
ncbi:MAG: hypothetical protein HY351_00800, partial [Candidatus Omnitrophica bacterium]|nr:hypothetical protein [Candidatus Omnitrophota bacterium]